MSRKYKFHEKDGAYFISFATAFWIDLFTRMGYFDIVIASLDYVHQNPVESGFVIEPWEWKYSSARNYCDDFEEILQIDVNR